MTAILVGAKKHPFSVNKRLLCEASPFFSERLLQDNIQTQKPVRLWLPSESSTMFTLFVHWLHSPSPAIFRRFLDERESSTPSSSSHDALIRLHLFASHLDLHRLQDLAMDAIQDLYLRQDWDVPPSLIRYLYTQCEAVPAVRLRRWAVAMVAFSLNSNDGGGDDDDDGGGGAVEVGGGHHLLFQSLPAFKADYATHMQNMKVAGLDVRFKNPQLRIAANKLRNDQRLVGFRECSFHSHRAAVGERPCPHTESPNSPLPAQGCDRMAQPGSQIPSPTSPVPVPSFLAKDRGSRRPRHVRSISSGLWAEYGEAMARKGCETRKMQELRLS